MSCLTYECVNEASIWTQTNFTVTTNPLAERTYTLNPVKKDYFNF